MAKQEGNCTPFKTTCGGQALLEGILMQGPGKRAMVDQLVALLKQEEETSGAAPFPVAAVARGGGEYQTQADAGITLPKDSTRVLSGRDRAETGDAAGAPAER